MCGNPAGRTFFRSVAMSWLSAQWNQVRTEGSPALLRKISVALAAGINAIWIIPCLIVIRVLRPWLLVRMGTLISERSGHFIIDAALYLAQSTRPSPGPRTIDLFWFREPTCNDQWARMVRRQLTARWWVRYLIFFNRLIPGGASHNLPSTNGSRDIDGILPRSTSRFAFSTDEENAAKAWLRRRGWQEGQPFICLLVRDSAYLSSHPLHTTAGHDHTTRHNHRDTDINAYVEAVQSLVDRGNWVIRMGKIACQHFPLDHQRVIDYPFVDDQDDLLDIWLSANCSLFVSTGTGIDAAPMVYNRPVIFVNYLPLSHVCSYANCTVVPKNLHWKKNDRLLTLKENLRHGHLAAQQYEQAGIAIEDLTSVEINAAVMEGVQRLDGTWVETTNNRARQIRFWQTLTAWPDFHKLHGYIHPEARVGSAWLKSMGDAFLEQ